MLKSSQPIGDDPNLWMALSLTYNFVRYSYVLLVGGLEHQFYFPIYWECHHPNWLSYFSEGWPNHQPDDVPIFFISIYSAIDHRDHRYFPWFPMKSSVFLRHRPRRHPVLSRVLLRSLGALPPCRAVAMPRVESWFSQIPSGKPTKNDGTSPFFMGKYG